MANFDRNLIFLYSENCRSRIKNLSELLKKSPQRLKYSLRVLEKEGVLDNLHCIFDYSYFGLILFRVYFKGGYVSEKDKANIIKKLTENPYVVAVYELSGEFDLAVEFESPNPSRFNKELKKVAELIPTLNNYKIMLNLVSHIYPRLYLVREETLKNIVQQEIIVGGDRSIQFFSQNEMSVMKNLLQNPNLRLTTLSTKSGISMKTANSVFKDLQKKKIIRGFRCLVNTNKLGIFKFRLFLRLHNLSQEKEKELTDYFMKTSEVVQLHKTVGDWDMEIDIESFDKARIRYIVTQMREEFRDLIQTFNSIEFYQTYKKAYIPGYLFDHES